MTLRYQCNCAAFYFSAAGLAVTLSRQVRLWDVGGSALERSCWRHHTEFATGIDWDLFSPGRVVSCGWDNTCVSWDIGA